MMSWRGDALKGKESEGRSSESSFIFLQLGEGGPSRQPTLVQDFTAGSRGGR